MQRAETKDKNVSEKSDDAYLLSIRVQTTFLFVFFLPQYQPQRKCCFIVQVEQPGVDSYQQWQIDQSDCEISSNCGKK